ncbi:MAG: hypothetical protein QOG01_2343 [Pseudonocardiales bacterium]|nr:hypothetical protein [Pseudonocardiales bacterium]
MSRGLRWAIPYSLLPLSLIACALASSPWLRAFPADVMAVPLFGAALLSVLTPLVVVGIGVRPLWITAIADIAIFVFYELLVTLREPAGFDSLYTGLVHGPSQLLTFALPLVSPRTLLVAPVALCWLSGTMIGECVARGWQSVLPYATLLVTFGLSYAGTARAVSGASDGHRYDTLLAGALLLTLLLLRAAQSWVVQERGAETTQADGILPLRGLVIGTVLSTVVALAAAAVVQSSAFAGRPVTPARKPPVDQTTPLTPVAFVSGLRPTDPKSKGDELFKVTIDQAASNYLSLATVDTYDGDGWTFTRTFRPSGGVISAETDPALRPLGKAVTQQYSIDRGPMTTVPWMPYLNRAQWVSGASVNIDTLSGMIVPSHPLRAGENYTVRSNPPTKDFLDLGKSARLATSEPPSATQLPVGVSSSLATLVSSLAAETGTPSTSVVPFLQSVAKTFRTKSALAGGPITAPPTPTATSAPRPASSTSPSPTASPTSNTGGTSFADVLASIRQYRSATPEQYATLIALLARELGVPARVVAGFRVAPTPGSTNLAAGTYAVTSAEAWTWVEIPVVGQGWVVLDASPGTYAGPNQQPTEGARPSQSPSPAPSQTALITQANNPNGHAVAPKSNVPHSAGISAAALILIVLAVIVAVAILLITLLLLRKRLRGRRRRRRGDPRRRLLGAWQESLDVLVEAGLPDLTYLTSNEVAAVTGDRFGGELAAQARYLGNAANAALFSPTSWIGSADADAAWRAQVVMSRSVRRRLGWRDRIRAGLRYHRTKRIRPQVGPTSWAAAARARAAANAGRGKHAKPRGRRGSSRKGVGRRPG